MTQNIQEYALAGNPPKFNNEDSCSWPKWIVWLGLREERNLWKQGGANLYTFGGFKTESQHIVFVLLSRAKSCLVIELTPCIRDWSGHLAQPTLQLVTSSFGYWKAAFLSITSFVLDVRRNQICQIFFFQLLHAKVGLWYTLYMIIRYNGIIFNLRQKHNW